MNLGPSMKPRRNSRLRKVERHLHRGGVAHSPARGKVNWQHQDTGALKRQLPDANSALALQRNQVLAALPAAQLDAL